ncbi:MAG: hypothetical protein ABIE84_02440 [bacterium]
MIFNWFRGNDLFYDEVFRKLKQSNVAYLVVGGIAVALYGAVRLTSDADIILELSVENVEKFIKAIGELGYKPKLPVDPQDFANPQIRESWIEEKGMKVFPFWHPDRPLEIIDVFVRNPINFQEMDNEKVVKKAMGLEVPIPSLRHLIELKKQAGRDQDLKDIERLEMLHGKTE